MDNNGEQVEKPSEPIEEEVLSEIQRITAAQRRDFFAGVILLGHFLVNHHLHVGREEFEGFADSSWKSADVMLAADPKGGER